jgi:hypothetical protein
VFLFSQCETSHHTLYTIHPGQSTLSIYQALGLVSDLEVAVHSKDMQTMQCGVVEEMKPHVGQGKQSLQEADTPSARGASFRRSREGSVETGSSWAM